MVDKIEWCGYRQLVIAEYERLSQLDKLITLTEADKRASYDSDTDLTLEYIASALREEKTIILDKLNNLIHVIKRNATK